VAPAPHATPPLTPRTDQPAEATAAWMITTYGRMEAETRARAALDFYDAQSVEGRYWRRVLASIVTAR
jgi:hypothetical protein